MEKDAANVAQEPITILIYLPVYIQNYLGNLDAIETKKLQLNQGEVKTIEYVSREFR